MAGRTSTGRLPSAGGGGSPELRPGEAAGTPPGLNQSWRPVRLPLRPGETDRSPPSTLSLSSGTPPDAVPGAGGVAGRVSGPARRRARRRARTNVDRHPLLLSVYRSLFGKNGNYLRMMRASMKEGLLLLHNLITCATLRFRSSRRLIASSGAKRQPGKTNRLEPGSSEPNLVHQNQTWFI